MATIKERGYIAIGHPLPPKGAMHVPDKLELCERTFVNGYIKGATDQQAIDIDKACEIYRKDLCEFVNMLNCVKKGSGDLIDIEKSITAFREEMTEQVSPN